MSYLSIAMISSIISNFVSCRVASCTTLYSVHYKFWVDRLKWEMATAKRRWSWNERNCPSKERKLQRLQWIERSKERKLQQEIEREKIAMDREIEKEKIAVEQEIEREKIAMDREIEKEKIAALAMDREIEREKIAVEREKIAMTREKQAAEDARFAGKMINKYWFDLLMIQNTAYILYSSKLATWTGLYTPYEQWVLEVAMAGFVFKGRFAVKKGYLAWQYLNSADHKYQKVLLGRLGIQGEPESLTATLRHLRVKGGIWASLPMICSLYIANAKRLKKLYDNNP
jgi:hypothetical protein